MYRQSEKNSLNNNISFTCSHNMVNFGPLAADISSWVWGTPANFNGFSLLPSLLHRRRLPEANQALHDFWPSPGLVHYRYILGFLPPDGILRAAKLTLRPSLALSCFDSVTARHWSGGRQPTLRHGTRNGIMEVSLLDIFNRGRHLYSEGDRHVGHWPTF